jgi:carbon dioxide concentrating mechanism protein CcmO
MPDDGVAILEITGLGPALVALDTLEKAAQVEIDHYELNDFYGVCARIHGTPAALEAAVASVEATIGRLGGQCVCTTINAPHSEARKIIRGQHEYQPLLEQQAVFFATPAANDTILQPEEEPKMSREAPFAIGLIETQGFTAVIEAIDTACKAANVEVIGKEKLGGGYITVIVKGDVAAVEAAIEAGKLKVDGLGKLISAHVIARPSEGILRLLPQA